LYIITIENSTRHCAAASDFTTNYCNALTTHWEASYHPFIVPRQQTTVAENVFLKSGDVIIVESTSEKTYLAAGCG